LRTIEADSVNEAYACGLSHLRQQGVEQDSRAGKVVVAPTPVTTVYRNPRQRVLFNATRDANPFFHLMESLWMLAGRNDATWLDLFVKDFSARFAEEQGVQHGAYGYRWRNHFDVDWGGEVGLTDQLDTVVRLLKADPNDRRVVIQMWDPIADLGVDKRDVPCNLCVLPRIRTELVSQLHRKQVLDITVFCRSNDAIWGAYGANAVHFSVLQEYLAARIGVGVGRYYQISNNFHAYQTALEKVGVPRLEGSPYQDGSVEITPIVTHPEIFDSDLRGFFISADTVTYSNGFFPDVAVPMLKAAKHWRAGDVIAAEQALCAMPAKSDWRVAGMAWLGRRRK